MQSVRCNHNESEIKFEQFCVAQGIPFERIDTGPFTTPDYDIYVHGQKVVVEVKEFETNEDDKKVLHEMETKSHVSSGIHRVGDRIRYKIDNAKHQLENRAKGYFPSLLVLYDTRPYPIRGISPYEIIVAMYGWETIDLHASEKAGEPIKFGPHRFGKGKKFREGVHTYISGLAVLSERGTNPLRLDIYVNDFVDKPLPFENLVQMENVSLFVRPPSQTNKFRNWARLVADRNRRQGTATTKRIHKNA